MAYTEEEREQIKIRIIEILRENETMNYQKLANMIIDENLAYSQHVVAHTLQRGCKNHKNYNGEDLFENPSRGLWKLSNKECIFCKMKDYILENELAYAIYDKYPVGKGHMLFIPKRHVKDFFDITKEEREAIFDLIDEGKKLLDEKYSPDSYNVGINCGEHAGQTIMHVHVHLIPRYIGDMKDPTGGVRGVIPEKMKY
ncbi:HIT family protein [Romboutsia timonensis]|uniref:HIT family protein n=1 Tax=Romboutsia timonensis TaxID=1776391 RepID=UPI002ED0307F